VQLNFIRGAAQNLGELVDDLLDIAKIEAGKIDVRPTRSRWRSCSARCAACCGRCW
jgi:signal transduction histidine kinase